MIDHGTIVRRNPEAVFRKLAEGSGAVLLDLKSAEYFGVNDFGAEIWNRLEEGVRFDALLDGLRSDLDDPPAELEADVAEFLDALRQRDLVILDPAPVD